jgi:hypothetical protein
MAVSSPRHDPKIIPEMRTEAPIGKFGGH